MSDRNATTRKPDILLVDDHQSNLTILKTLLETNGYHIRMAISGEDAFSKIQDYHPDLILLDIMMPDMDGYEVCQYLKSNHETAYIPVIFLSALSKAQDKVMAFEVGGVDYISKPFQLAEVLARVQMQMRLLQQKREIDQLRELDQSRIDQLEREIERRKILERESRKLQRAVESSGNSIVITDAQGAIEYVNPKFVDVSGYAFEEVLGKKPSILKSGYTSDSEYAELWQTVKSGREWRGSFHNRKKNGDLFWETATISPIFNENNEITHFVSVKEDVTSRKEAEQELYDINQRLLVLNRLISSSTVNLTVPEVLEIACKETAYVYNAEQAIAFLFDDDHTIATVTINYPINAQQPNDVQQVTISDDDVYNYLDRYRIPLPISDPYIEPSLEKFKSIIQFKESTSALVVPIQVKGQLVGMFFILTREKHDFSHKDIVLSAEIAQACAQSLENSLLLKQIAEQNQRLEDLVAERTDQLLRLNERMATVLASVQDGIIVFYDDGTISMTNVGFENQYGYLPDELFGQHFTELATPDYQKALTKAFEQAISLEKPASVDFIAQRKDGGVFDASITFSLVNDDNGNVVASCHDISHLKEMERIKNNFVSMVTHELRTPIAAVTLISGSLQRHFAKMNDELRIRKIDQLHTQAQLMADLVESVLDLSRLEARSFKPKRMNDVEMSVVLHQIVDELTNSIQNKSQQVILEVQEPLLPVQGDAVDFGRIWRNLLSNAHKYTEDNGTLTLRLNQMRIDTAKEIHWYNKQVLSISENIWTDLTPGAYLVGQVEDNGHGISDEDMSKLFERFQRGWAGQSTIMGTGLGLSLVQDLIHMYQGDIFVESVLGEGSTFTFWLPIITEEVVS